jgi:hypothetical protein
MEGLVVGLSELHRPLSQPGPCGDRARGVVPTRTYDGASVTAVAVPVALARSATSALETLAHRRTGQPLLTRQAFKLQHRMAEHARTIGHGSRHPPRDVIVNLRARRVNAQLLGDVASWRLRVKLGCSASVARASAMDPEAAERRIGQRGRRSARFGHPSDEQTDLSGRNGATTDRGHLRMIDLFKRVLPHELVMIRRS